MGLHGMLQGNKDAFCPFVRYAAATAATEGKGL